MPLFIIIAAVLYIMAGLAVARQNYVLETKRFLAIANSDEGRQARMDEIERELKNMTHGICNLNYSSLRSRGCDCSNSKRWSVLNTELDELEAGEPLRNAPGPQYSVIVTWPYTGVKNFLTPEVTYQAPKEIEAPASEGTPLIDPTLSYNPFSIFEDDPFSKQLREGWAAIKEQAERELAEVKKDDPLAFASEVEGDKISVINGNGKVIKTFSNEVDFPKIKSK